MNKQVIVATNNNHKVLEINKIMKQLLPSVEVLTLNDVNYVEDIEEFGLTFYQNALIKAEHIAKVFPEAIVIADDSGLEVNALNQAPGVYSARYAMDEEAYKKNKDLTNNLKLLKELNNHTDRTACFKTVLAIIVPNNDPVFVSGQVDGIILDKMQGDNGFGYDPLFSHNGTDTFAMLSDNEKNSLSHRANALSNMAKLDLWKEL